MTKSDKQTIKSVEKLFEIVEVLIEADGAHVVEISESTGFNQSTIYVHLNTLIKLGLVEKDGNKYFSSLQFLSYGEQIKRNYELYHEGKDELNKLSNRTGELANLTVREGNRGIVIYMSEGDNAVHDHIPGRELPMHASATGKALLAHLPKKQVEEIVDEQGLSEITEYTITDRDRLLDQLETIHQQEYAFDDEEGGIGIRCVAAPIIVNSDPIGAVSVTGPAKRISDETQDEIIDEVTNTANVIEVKMEYS